MLLDNKSILKKLPVKKIDERTLEFLDALSHTISTIETMYRRLLHYLLHHNQNQKQKDAFFEEVLSDVWGLVDNFNRLRSLLNKASGIKKNTPWFQSFIRKLRDIEDVRHFIQHYDEKIEYLAMSNQPAKGYLCWVKVERDDLVASSFLYFGRVKKNSEMMMINPLGKKISRPIDLVTYHIGEMEINISELVKSLLAFVKELETFLEDKYGSNSFTKPSNT